MDPLELRRLADRLNDVRTYRSEDRDAVEEAVMAMHWAAGALAIHYPNTGENKDVRFPR